MDNSLSHVFAYEPFVSLFELLAMSRLEMKEIQGSGPDVAKNCVGIMIGILIFQPLKGGGLLLRGLHYL